MKPLKCRKCSALLHVFESIRNTFLYQYVAETTWYGDEHSLKVAHAKMQCYVVLKGTLNLTHDMEMAPTRNPLLEKIKFFNDWTLCFELQGKDSGGAHVHHKDISYCPYRKLCGTRCKTWPYQQTWLSNPHNPTLVVLAMWGQWTYNPIKLMYCCRQYQPDPVTAII